MEVVYYYCNYSGGSRIIKGGGSTAVVMYLECIRLYTSGHTCSRKLTQKGGSVEPPFCVILCEQVSRIIKRGFHSGSDVI